MVESRHIYKVYRDNEYLGLLPYVISDFSYPQEINTLAAETIVQVLQPFDIAQEATEPILTEDGEPLLDEAGHEITTEGQLPIVGDKDSGLLIANGNKIEIWEYSDYEVNGELVFTGYQTRLRGSLKSSVLSLVLISEAVDTNNYIFANATNFVSEVQQLTETYPAVVSRGNQGGSWPPYLAQSFTGHSFTLSNIQLKVALGSDELGVYPTSATVTVNVYSGTPSGTKTLLSTASKTITNVLPTYAFTNFTLALPITLSSSTQYFFTVGADDLVSVKFTDPSAYASGNAFLGYLDGSWLALSTSDLTFKLMSGVLKVDAEFTNTDPSDMVRDALDGYGGIATYTVSSIEDTGYDIDYTFKLATAAEVIEKAREFAPSDFYYYADPATPTVYFKSTSTTPDHTFIIGRHITDMDYESTIEYIKNVVYFTGGPTAGENLLKKYTDTASLAINRVGLERIADNRIVTANEPAAEAIANNLMEQNSDEVNLADPVTIHASTYNIRSIKLGDTAEVKATGNYIETLLFQVTSLRRYTDYVELRFGRLPIRSSAYVDEIKRKLEKEQTLANPDTPG